MDFSATSSRADTILQGTFLRPHREGERVQTHLSTRTPTEPLQPQNDETDSQEPEGNTPLHLQWTTLPDLVQQLVDSFQYTTTPDVVPVELTPDEYRGKLQWWDEKTSTSPTTDMHLGHLRAYWAEHTLPNGTPEAAELEAKRKDILDGHILLINYALQTGYSYEPWKRIVNTMLEKDPGLPKIHRLRVIHLYEADYNLILRVKWRQVLHHAVTNGLINKGCYGSQPGKEATDALFIRELEYEIGRITRKSSLHFDNDATSCYDRILCFLANLASQKYGMQKKICVVQGKTLAEAKYFLKTKC